MLLQRPAREPTLDCLRTFGMIDDILQRERAVAADVQNRVLEPGGAVTARLDQRIRADMPTLLVPIPEPRL